MMGCCKYDIMRLTTLLEYLGLLPADQVGVLPEAKPNMLKGHYANSYR